MLLAAIALSTTVVLFAVNITSSQAQKEKVFVASTHVWYVDSISAQSN
jgi:hypothetical protein